MSQNGSANSGKPMTNADNGAHSQTLDHVTSYPLVTDLLNFYTHNSLGAKSIEAFNRLYATFVNPLLPYLQTPLSIASPYLTRADQLGDHSLSYVDNTFPSLKRTDFSSLKGGAVGVATYPFVVLNEGKEYVFNTYADESKKVGGEGVVNVGKSVVSTQMRVVGDAVNMVRETVGLAEKKVKEKKSE